MYGLLRGHAILCPHSCKDCVFLLTLARGERASKTCMSGWGKYSSRVVVEYSIEASYVRVGGGTFRPKRFRLTGPFG